jgi:biotin carboxyl carrier protein
MADTKKTCCKAPAESGAEKATLARKYIKQETWVNVSVGTVLSFMPGTVEDVKVKVGDKVKAGDLLMVFRAMKMNNKILAPAAGTITSINVKKGENLPKNVVMIEIN